MFGRVTGDPGAVARIVRGAWEGDKALMAEYRVLKILKSEGAKRIKECENNYNGTYDR